MKNYAQTPNRLPWPPIIYAASILAAAILQDIAPVRFFDAWLQMAPSFVGVLLCLAGLALHALAVRELWRQETTMLPNAAATRLVTTGVFRYTRNPIYIGDALALVGVAVAFRWTWLLVMLPPAVSALRAKAVLAEERHLAVRFARAWHDYARRTPRWF